MAELAYRVARFVESPIRPLWRWLDGVEAGAWCEDGWIPNRRQLWASRATTLLTRLSAIIYLWIARNSEDWSLCLALKGTVCLILGLRSTSANCYKYIDAAWWSRYEFKSYPRSWESVRVGEGREWFTDVETEEEDCEYG